MISAVTGRLPELHARQVPDRGAELLRRVLRAAGEVPHRHGLHPDRDLGHALLRVRHPRLEAGGV